MSHHLVFKPITLTSFAVHKFFARFSASSGFSLINYFQCYLDLSWTWPLRSFRSTAFRSGNIPQVMSVWCCSLHSDHRTHILGRAISTTVSKKSIPFTRSNTRRNILSRFPDGSKLLKAISKKQTFLVNTFEVQKIWQISYTLFRCLKIAVQLATEMTARNWMQLKNILKRYFTR